MRVVLVLILFVFLFEYSLSVPPLVVYDGTTGTLPSGWNNFSWAKVNLQSTDFVRPNEKYSASMVCTGWQGLFLSRTAMWSVADYNTFSFWINGGPDAKQTITVQLTADNNSKSLGLSDYLPNHAMPHAAWVQVQIPLSHFDIVGGSQIKGFWFQANSDGGEVAYFSDIQFEFVNIPPSPGPDLNIDASQVLATVHPEIFGVTIFWDQSNEAAYSKFVQEISLPLNRIGGDATTRYNWMVDSSNSGFDWYFMGGSGASSVIPGAWYDNFISENNKYKTKTVVTVPMIQMINKASALHCSFPKSKYPNQQSYNPYEHPNGDDCGNGKAQNGNNILDTDPTSHDVANTPDLQRAWVQHIVQKFGSSASSGVLYQLDNEVSNWAYMHRDVHPNPVTYDEIINQTILYASAVKRGDPSATVAAPSEIQFAWFPDWGGDKNVIKFLQALKAYEQQNGKRILDSYDCHYPDTNNHWPKMTDVEHLRGVVDQTYPGTAISFSEWSLTGTGPLNGALAVADELGHFAKNGVIWASYWGIGTNDLQGPVSFAFRLFRNYDGKGSKYGDKYVSSKTANDAVLSVHAALRNSDGALTILVINKIAADQETKVTLAGFRPQTTAKVFEFGAANENAIVAKPDITVSGTGFSHSFSAFSLTLVVIPRA